MPSPSSAEIRTVRCASRPILSIKALLSRLVNRKATSLRPQHRLLARLPPTRRRIREDGQEVSLVQDGEPLPVPPDTSEIAFLISSDVCADGREDIRIRVVRRVGVVARWGGGGAEGVERVLLLLNARDGGGGVNTIPVRRVAAGDGEAISIAIPEVESSSCAVAEWVAPPLAVSDATLQIVLHPSCERVASCVLLVRALAIVLLHSRPNPQNLDHPPNRSSEHHYRQHDGNEHRRPQRHGVLSLHTLGESDSDGSSKAGPEEHHLVRVGQLIGAGAASLVEDVDALGDGEDGAVASDADGELLKEEGQSRSRLLRPQNRERRTYSGDEDEHGLVDELSLGEETEAEVDEDEVLAQLSERAKHVATGALRPMRHVVVGVVLERDSAEEERDDACLQRRGVSAGLDWRESEGRAHHSW